MFNELTNRVFDISSGAEFDLAAMEVFKYQAEHNPVYKSFISKAGFRVEEIGSVAEIPFLPITLFKSSEIKTGSFEPQMSFRSSGTTTQNRSTHYIKDLSLYRESFIRGFKQFYGDPGATTVYALLPSYLERGDSSLVYMADSLIKSNRNGRGGFFLNNYNDLLRAIKSSVEGGEDIILLGVTFALLDLAEKTNADLSGITVMETGGMKGKRREMIREEVHKKLTELLNVDAIHSEYGMTELLSQAWSKGDGIFESPAWMKVIIRDPLDPWRELPTNRTGGVNIIDLANIYSCSFIETSDLGIRHQNGSFEIVGRFDNSDIRGCNLLLE